MLRTASALLTGAILLVLGFMFSVILFAVLAVVGLALWGYLLWKTRKLRRAMQERASTNGHVIDGEAVVVEEYRVTAKNMLPGDPGQPPPTRNSGHP